MIGIDFVYYMDVVNVVETTLSKDVEVITSTSVGVEMKTVIYIIGLTLLQPIK